MAHVQQAWNLETFGFHMSKALKGVIQAATVDNVQKSTLTAIDRLGSIITVHPLLIGKAVDVLGGTTHVGVDRLKTQVGVESGGIALAIRHSASATRCFLLITALKLYLKNDEVAEVLYHMMAQASMMEKAPVSQAQLLSLIATVEPHAKLLLSQEQISNAIVGPATDYLSKLPQGSAGSSNGSQLFHVLATEKLALILLGVFVARRKETVSSVELYGRFGGIWLASLFSWLLPEDTGLVIDKTSIFGQRDRFLFINIDMTAPILEQWHCKEFQHVAHLESILWDRGKVPQVLVRALLPSQFHKVGTALIDQMAPKMTDIVSETVQERKGSFLPWR